MVPNIKRTRKERRKILNKTSKLQIKTSKEEIKSPNAQLPTVLNISIPNVLKNMIPRSFSNILTLIHYILGVLYTTAMFVE